MKNLTNVFLSMLVMVLSSMLLTGCQVAGAIFDAGLYFGLLLAVVGLVLFVAIAAKAKK